MEKIQIFIQLTRLNKPIGFLLLFWPCVWGLTLGYYFNNETELYIKYIILFFLGSVLMRSAGCIVNDIVDKDFDKGEILIQRKLFLPDYITYEESQSKINLSMKQLFLDNWLKIINNCLISFPQDETKATSHILRDLPPLNLIMTNGSKTTRFEIKQNAMMIKNRFIPAE